MSHVENQSQRDVNKEIVDCMERNAVDNADINIQGNQFFQRPLAENIQADNHELFYHPINTSSSG